MVEIVYVKHGIGNNFGEVIELNENLKKWPNLHQAIIEHELMHTKKAFTKQDLIADMTEHKVNRFELLRFMLKNPKSFSQILPLYYTKNKGLVYDLNLSLFYVFIATCIFLTLFVSIKYF